MTTTAKRQRQREGRVARMEAERLAAQRAARRRRIITGAVVAVVVIALLVLVSALGGDDEGGGEDEGAATTTTQATPSTTAPPKPDVTVPEGAPPTTLQTTDLVVGDGAEAQAGSALEVHYVGKSTSTGEEFDSSYEREAFAFTLGQEGIIPGWTQGIAGMREGGRRQLVIPPDLAYGPEGDPPDIAPNDTLVFVIDLLSVDETPAEPGG